MEVELLEDWGDMGMQGMDNMCKGKGELQQNRNAGLEIKPQKLWFRPLFKAGKAAAREKGKQMNLNTTYNWYCGGEGEQSNAWPALREGSILG